MKRIGIVAGEASGDLLGAKLITAIRKKYPDVKIEGLGGPAMIAQGFDSLHDMERLSVMGLIEPLKRLPDLFKLRRDLYQHFIKNPPDVFIGIDSPDFNLGLELKLKKAGLPVIHYVSPSVWAWRQGRIKKIAKAVDLMLTLFPFEAGFYQRHHVPVQYVGHPLAEQIPLQIDKPAAKQSLGIQAENLVIALLPGSRRQELQYMAKPYLLAALQIAQMHPGVCFITPCANEARDHQWQSYCQQFAPQLSIQTVIGKSHAVLAAADLAVVTSGTATLECMLYKTPMVTAYRMSSLAFQIVKRLVKTPFIALPNLLADQYLVPELIQNQVTPIAIANHLNDLLMHPEKCLALKDHFLKLHRELAISTSERLIEAVSSVAAR